MAVRMIKVYEEEPKRHFDQVRDVTDFIRNCRNDGMNKSGTIEAMVDQLHYIPTEADIIVNEFWDKTA